MENAHSEIALDAEEIIRLLGLEPHPEGGHFVQTFRDRNGGERGHSTAIYYLLREGERSHWHQVTDASEVWLYHAGAPLKLHLSPDGATSSTLTLGTDLRAGERPQGIVPPGWWQSAESTGRFTLVSCTVAPGFTFDSFVMAAPGWNPADR